ncbi:hypothetical protein RBB50_001504 [Rhinocladiella similis]
MTPSATIVSTEKQEQDKGNQSLVLSGDDLCYPKDFEFFKGHAGLFPGQPTPIHRIRFPRFKTFAEERYFRKLHHAAALRWLGSQGYGNEGAGGHMTVRDPEFPDHLWINPFGRSLNHMTPEDLVLVNDEGHVVGGNMHVVNPAGFYIHSGVHRARPDVQAVVHMHTIAGKAYSPFGEKLQMFNQDCCQFYQAHSVFPSFDGFVLADEEGKKIAEALGPTNKAVILQNHGLLTVGKTPDGAAFTFGALERCLEAQVQTYAVAQASGFKPRVVTEAQALGVKQFYTDEFLYMTFQPAFEDVVRASTGVLPLQAPGEIYPDWNAS